MSKEHSARSGSERARRRAASIVSPTMNAWPSVCIDWRSAARTIGATTGLVRLAADTSPESSAETSGRSLPAALSSVSPVRSSRSVSPRTPASRMAASRSAISWSARFASGVRSSASARLMSALPCALSSGNCSSIRSTSGRERWSARATSTHRAARARAPASAACTAVKSAISSLEAPASGRSVASRSSVRSAARSSPPVALILAARSPREYRRDRAREVLEILAPQARDVHAAVVDHVDVMAGAQLAYLLGRDPEQREHAVVARDEAEIAARAVRGELPDHLAPQPLDALAHGIDLCAPLSPQLRIAQDAVDDRGAVIGRHRPQSAREAHQLAHGGICLRRRLAHDAERPGALAVEPEVLRARHGEHHLGELGAEEPQPERVGVEPL